MVSNMDSTVSAGCHEYEALVPFYLYWSVSGGWWHPVHSRSSRIPLLLIVPRSA